MTTWSWSEEVRKSKFTLDVSAVLVVAKAPKNSTKTKQCCHDFRKPFIFVYVPDGHQKRVCNYLNRIWVVRISTMPADLFGRHLRRMRNSVAVTGFAKSACEKPFSTVV